MIKDLFLYFAKFPERNGVLSMFTNGSSNMPEYLQLRQAISKAEVHSLIPEIKNYVYGQDFDDVKERVDRLFGSWLMVDYGKFGFSGSGSGSLITEQHIAVTVAEKISDIADMVERMIISDTTLRYLNRIYAYVMADSDSGEIDWIDRDEILRAEIIPFVASELKSAGWTLVFTASAHDPMDINSLRRTYRKSL